MEKVSVRNLKPGDAIVNPYTGTHYGVVESVTPAAIGGGFNIALRYADGSKAGTLFGNPEDFEYEVTRADKPDAR